MGNMKTFPTILPDQFYILCLLTINLTFFSRISQHCSQKVPMQCYRSSEFSASKGGTTPRPVSALTLLLV